MRVWITGGSGMVGTSLLRLAPQIAPALTIVAPRRDMLDLSDASAVRRFLHGERIDAVIHTAGKVGGIGANMDAMAAFLAENLAINLAVIGESAEAGVAALINFGSSCMYPANFRQPLVETDILAAPLEPTNEGYAIAKIAAAKHCRYIAENGGRAFRTIIPSNLYGPGDHFSLSRGHLVASAIRKVHDAKLTGAESVEIWGDGLARREFLFVDDLARWVLLTALPEASRLPQDLNVGLGQDFSVNQYYQVAAKTVGFEGRFSHDLRRPVGMRQKLMNSGIASKYGWCPKTSLEDGMAAAYAFFLEQGSIS